MSMVSNHLRDRLRALTLPAVDEVRDGLESYVETKERAEELETKIERTDELIDEIVYELYGLTDEGIEIVEDAVEEESFGTVAVITTLITSPFSVLTEG